MLILSSDLRNKGFVINPYDPCVEKKRVNGKQMMVTCHVDDLNISHVKSSKVTRIIEWLESQYGNMHISRGEVYNYLAIYLDYLVQG